jgi:hypothetical protein
MIPNLSRIDSREARPCGSDSLFAVFKVALSYKIDSATLSYRKLGKDDRRNGIRDNS